VRAIHRARGKDVGPLGASVTALNVD
jgi:hypothetical protein